MEYTDERKKSLQKLEKIFKEQKIYVFNAKKYNKECSFDYILNRLITVTIVYSEREIQTLHDIIYERKIFIDNIVGAIIYVTNGNFYVFDTNNIYDLKSWFKEVNSNLSSYKLNLDNFNLFTISNDTYNTVSVKQYNEDNLLKILTEQINTLGRVPTVKEIKHPSYMIYYKIFGSFNNALEILGCRPVRYRANIKENDKKVLLQIIQDKAKELKRTPKMTDIIQSKKIRKVFGSWNNALRLAGFEINKKIVDNEIVVTSDKKPNNKKNILKYMNAINLAVKHDISPNKLKAIINFAINILDSR